MSSVLELTNIQQTVKFRQNNCLANMLNLPKHWQQFLLLECWPKPSAIHHEDPRCLLRQKTCREKRWTSNEAGRRATRPHRLVMTTAALSTALHTRRHMACRMLATPAQNTDQPGKKNTQHTAVMCEACRNFKQSSCAVRTEYTHNSIHLNNLTQVPLIPIYHWLMYTFCVKTI